MRIVRIVALLCDQFVQQTRRGASYSPYEDFSFAKETRQTINTAVCIRTDVDFDDLLRQAYEAEQARVKDDHNEDDLDGWELESVYNESPLSSLPPSRSP